MQSLFFGENSKSVFLHWRHLLVKLSATAICNSHVTVLALDTLGDATQIGSFLFGSCHPRWPRACIIKLITAIIYGVFFLESLYSLV
jgi:hypothetical protein